MRTVGLLVILLVFAGCRSKKVVTERSLETLDRIEVADITLTAKDNIRNQISKDMQVVVKRYDLDESGNTYLAEETLICKKESDITEVNSESELTDHSTMVQHTESVKETKAETEFKTRDPVVWLLGMLIIVLVAKYLFKKFLD